MASLYQSSWPTGDNVDFYFDGYSDFCAASGAGPGASSGRTASGQPSRPPAPRAGRASSAAASKASKASKTSKPAKANSDHRKEQNRLASRNYREKRKQKLALLQQILDDPVPPDVSSVPLTSTLSGGLSPSNLDLLAPAASSELPPPPPPPPPPQPPQQTLLDPFSNWLQGFTNQATGAHTALATAAPDMPDFPHWVMPDPAAQLFLSPADASPAAAPASMPAHLPPPPPPPTSVPALSAASSTSPPSSSAASSSGGSLPEADLFFSGLLSQPAMPPASPATSQPWHNSPATTTAASMSVASAPLSTTSPPEVQPAPASSLSPFSVVSPGRTTTLPSRPSPQSYPFAFGALPADSKLPPQPSTTTIQPPVRRRRRPNAKPVVRAMLHCIHTLTPQEKQRLARALMHEDDGRIEELADDDDDDDGDEEDDEGGHAHPTTADAGGWGESPAGAAAAAAAPNHHVTTPARLPWRHERRRQVFHRWNKELAAEPTLLAALDSPFVSTASPASGASGASGPHQASPRAPAILPLTTMTLQCRRSGFYAAILQNCLACGLVDLYSMFAAAGTGGYHDPDTYDEAYLAETDNALSPFTLDAAEAVAGVREALAGRGRLPPHDLQPTEAQILVAHHPYLDILPFPEFRTRALTLLAEMEAAEEAAAAATTAAAAGPYGDTNNISNYYNAGSVPSPACLFDEDELCYDMAMADGLVCWGGASGDTAAVSAQGRRSPGMGRDMRACVPWDGRSWEPQVWFLKKYWFLVGGWDDEMWRNCRWWHSMRGEELDYSVFASPS
ncbi:hypothetical protein SPI_00102 [Niveomyces insectorum RCEF 264]|uniref:BZIP domain-containing protein n=1 Tax=Niveomyces insectorum RCEF 264 TaxID=1081102 RepID=A0A167ZU09_9HYPO|nr:hypothetical protein SPI_00102 [Niveomyces insectorum RCEF 264]